MAAIEQRGHLAVAKEMVFRQMNSHLRYPCAQLIVTTTMCRPSSEMRFIPISRAMFTNHGSRRRLSRWAPNLFRFLLDDELYCQST